MAQPSDRETFKEYCLRKLGAPVIEINVADEQVEDRIDEATALYYPSNTSTQSPFNRQHRHIGVS
jgi:hypothetical protein